MSGPKRRTETVFEAKLARALRPHTADALYLVGVSGGRDSVALLDGLVAAGYRRLVVCHLDHGLRGAESAADAEFVRRLAEGRELPVELGRADVRRLMRQRKQSLETTAREARYQFFAETAEHRGCQNVFLAHHADDQVETFLFNLLRGAGPTGLGAMAASRERRIGQGKLRLLRPMLGIWRAEIDEHLRARGLAWREDATNADPTHATRNAMREKVLPMLERLMGREVRPALWRAADILATEDAWCSAMMDAGGPLPDQLPVAELLAQHVARQRRVIRRWLTALGIGGVGYEEVERVRGLLDVRADVPAKVNLPGGKHARRRAGVLFVE